MISWWLPCLAKGPMPDFNNGPGNDLNSSCSLNPQHLFETDLNNGPSPSHSNSMSDGVYICSGFLLMVSWKVPYLSKCRRPDFNNGLGVTRIVAPFWPPSVYLSPTQIMAPPLALYQMKYTSVQVPNYDFSWWLPCLIMGPTPDFNNGPGNDLNSSYSLNSRRLFESDSNNCPPQAIAMPNYKHNLAQKRT